MKCWTWPQTVSNSFNYETRLSLMAQNEFLTNCQWQIRTHTWRHIFFGSKIWVGSKDNAALSEKFFGKNFRPQILSSSDLITENGAGDFSSHYSIFVYTKIGHFTVQPPVIHWCTFIFNALQWNFGYVIQLIVVVKCGREPKQIRKWKALFRRQPTQQPY